MRNQRYFVKLNKQLLWFITFYFQQFFSYYLKTKKTDFLNETKRNKKFFCSYLSQSCNLESPKVRLKLMETELVSQISSFPTLIFYFNPWRVKFQFSWNWVLYYLSLVSQQQFFKGLCYICCDLVIIFSGPFYICSQNNLLKI